MTKGNEGIRSSNYNFARADALEDTIFHCVANASDLEELCFPVSEQKFSREEVARWCMVRGWKSQFAFHERGSNAAWHVTDDPDPSKEPAAQLVRNPARSSENSGSEQLCDADCGNGN